MHISYASQLWDISYQWILEKEKEIDVFRQKIEGGKEEISEDVDFMTFMILAGKMNRKELAMNTIDLIGAGIESVSNITIKGVRSIVD